MQQRDSLQGGGSSTTSLRHSENFTGFLFGNESIQSDSTGFQMFKWTGSDIPRWWLPVDVFIVWSTTSSIVNLWHALHPEDVHVYWSSKLLGDCTSYLERFATRTSLYKLISRVIRKETEDIFDVYLCTVQRIWDVLLTFAIDLLIDC